MEIQQTKQNDILVLEPVGRLDTNTSHELEEKAIGLVGEGEKRFVIDFVKLEYISSAGLRVLLMLAKKLKSMEGDLVLCSMSPHVKEVFDIAGFTRIFTIEESQAQALQSLSGDAGIAQVSSLVAELMAEADDEDEEDAQQPAAADAAMPPPVPASQPLASSDAEQVSGGVGGGAEGLYANASTSVLETLKSWFEAVGSALGLTPRKSR